MWWKISLFVLVASIVFAVLGVYAGGALFLFLTEGDPATVTWHTMYDASKVGWGLDDGKLMYLPWCVCLAIGMTFLPLVLTVIALFIGKGVSSLHGDARFANDKELALLDYKGEYQ
jgi:hypothetical protein